MTKATNEIERFADFINAMDFHEVIDFFNFAMSDMLQNENHAIFNPYVDEDAIRIIKVGGAKALAEIIGYPEEERAVMCRIDQKGDLHWTWGFNPWTEILDGYAEWILDHVKTTYDQQGNAADIIVAYPKIKDVILTKKKFKVRVSWEVYDYFDIEAQTEEEAKAEAEEIAIRDGVYCSGETVSCIVTD